MPGPNLIYSNTKYETMGNIPKRFPTRLGDRFLASADDIFSMIIQMEMEFDYPLDEKRLAKAVALTMDVEPVLGCRFVPRFMRPYWERVAKQSFDFCILTHSKTEYEIFKNRKIDSYSGPQIFVCLYRSKSGDKLLIKVSHLPSDAAGVKDIAATVSSIYNKLADNPDYAPTPNIEGSRSMRHIVRHVPRHAWPMIVFNHLKDHCAALIPFKSHNASMRHIPDQPGKYAVRHISRDNVDGLIEYARKFDATINDLFLAAIFRALSKLGDWKEKEALRLGTTVDLRRYLPTGKAESISNFSSVEVFTYGTSIENDFKSVLMRVRDRMNRKKSSWLGLNSYAPMAAMMWALPFPWLRNFSNTLFGAAHTSSNTYDLFTNIGNIPAHCVDFGGKPIRAWFMPPSCDLPVLFFSLSGYDGSLSLSTSIVPNSVNETTADNFFSLLLAELPPPE